MNKAEKVVWSEGMLLRPHYFQQSESYLQSNLRDWGAVQRSYLWGCTDLEFDEVMLRQGKIALSAASGLLPDGTPFSFLDARQASAPLEIADSQSNVTNTLPPQMSQILLTASARDQRYRHLHVSFAQGEFQCQFEA